MNTVQKVQHAIKHGTMDCFEIHDLIIEAIKNHSLIEWEARWSLAEEDGLCCITQRVAKSNKLHEIMSSYKETIIHDCKNGELFIWEFKKKVFVSWSGDIDEFIDLIKCKGVKGTQVKKFLEKEARTKRKKLSKVENILEKY